MRFAPTRYKSKIQSRVWRSSLPGPLFKSSEALRQHKVSGLGHFLLLHFYSLQLFTSSGRGLLCFRKRNKPHGILVATTPSSICLYAGVLACVILVNMVNYQSEQSYAMALDLTKKLWSSTAHRWGWGLPNVISLLSHFKLPLESYHSPTCSCMRKKIYYACKHLNRYMYTRRYLSDLHSTMISMAWSVVPLGLQGPGVDVVMFVEL